LLLVDECFIDFLPRPETHTVKGYIKQYPGLIVLKAFTKTFAMAGIRLGYLFCARADIMKKISGAGQPWPVSIPAQAAGIAALKDEAYLAQSRIVIQKENRFLRREINNMGYSVIGSEANFIFFESPDAALADKMRDKGILIRDCRNCRGLHGSHFRVAVRKREENDILLKNMREFSG
jgi:threonine-phosphate decarboxylase